MNAALPTVIYDLIYMLFSFFFSGSAIIMGVPSDHAYGDKHGLIFLIKKKCKEKEKRKRRRRRNRRYSHCCIVSSASRLTKSRRGQRIEYRKRNSEAGCSIPSFASDSSQQSSPDSFEVLTTN